MEGFRYPVDVSKQTNQEAIDLLSADKAEADQNAGTVALSFKHRLSGVILKISAGENMQERELAGLQADITGQTVKGWYDINANELSPSTEGASQSIAFKMEGDGKSGGAVILPAAGGSGRTVKLTLNTGNGLKVTFTKRIANDKAFEAGVRYQFPITLYRPSPTASVEEISAAGGFTGTAAIEDWEEVVVEPDELTPEGPKMSSVTVSPSSVEVVKGGTSQFTATVSGTGNPPQTVTWSVSGGGSGTSINASGLLTVGANETATTLTVRQLPQRTPLNPARLRLR